MKQRPIDTNDDAADTLRFRCLDLAAEAPSDPDATSIYDLRAASPPRYVGHARSAALGRRIRSIRRDIAGLRDAIAAGWDVGPELAHEERRLSELLAE